MTIGGITFVAIPAGEFVMGDNSGPAIEQPAHRVRLDAFWIARTELTFGQWQAFLGDSGHPRGRSNGAGNEHPVVSVRWDDARAYCEWFSGKYGVIARLPTEAEWEYAARGGLHATQYPNGDSISQGDANYDSKGPVKVGSFRPNGYGVFDMAGNVAEWVADWYDPAYYARSARENPRGPETDPNRPQRRADRGSGWCLGAAFARVSARHAGPGSWDSGGTADCLGFRPVIESPRTRR
jgi:formylglycine-generating enzyme required for sulfatase activity